MADVYIKMSGGFGCRQFFLIFLLFVIIVSVSIFYASVSFLELVPEYNCVDRLGVIKSCYMEDFC